MLSRISLLCVLAAALALFTAAPASATIIATVDTAEVAAGDTSTGWYNYVLSSTDLANQGQTTFLSIAATQVQTAWGCTVDDLNNGTGYGINGNIGKTGGSYAGTEGAQITITFDTSVNTDGYNITKIKTLSGFSAYSRQKQNYDVSWAAPGSSTFSSLYSTGTLGSIHGTGAGGGENLVTLQDSGLGGVPIATGVGALRFTVHNVSGSSGETIYREFDVFGAPVPEPGTLALLATGLIGLLCYAWRRRK